MKTIIRKADKSDKEIIRNLLEKYLYEFSFYTKVEVDESGMFGYDYLDNYWTENNRFPYLIYTDKKLSGFALVNNYRELDFDTDYCMSEFFVLPNYRKQGVGLAACKEIFKIHHGSWQLQYHPDNKVSALFWNKVVHYFSDNVKMFQNYKGSHYPNDVNGTVLIFEVN